MKISIFFINKTIHIWVYETSYWIGSAFDSFYFVWYIKSDGKFSGTSCGTNDYLSGYAYGVRPVIVI